MLVLLILTKINTGKNFLARVEERTFPIGIRRALDAGADNGTKSPYNG